MGDRGEEVRGARRIARKRGERIEEAHHGGSASAMVGGHRRASLQVTNTVVIPMVASQGFPEVQLSEETWNCHLIWEKRRKRRKASLLLCGMRQGVIEFLGQRTPIILKNKDIRCSLVALCKSMWLHF